MKSAEPVRTCVGCGGRDGRGALVRFVAAGDGLALDPACRAPGRGAWLHRRPECGTAFVRRRGPIRSLRRPVTPAARERLVALISQR